VPMVEMRRGKGEFARLHDRSRLSLRRVILSVGFLPHSG